MASLAHRLAFGFILLAAAPGIGQGQPTGSPASGTITILATSDFHGRHTPFPAGPGDATSQSDDPGASRSPFSFDRQEEIGGFATLAAAVVAIRQERGPERVLLVHAGDTFSDDLLMNLTRGEAMIQLMNAIGYDFMAFGNHDFDYGLERTRELAQMAEFPMRGANVLEQETDEPLFGAPYRIVEVEGIRVALLALGYHNTDWTTNPDNVRGLRFTSGIEAARRWVPELRRQAEVVVVVSHQGTKVDKLLAREVEGIDLIVGGHSHDLLTPGSNGAQPATLQGLSDAAVLGEAVVQVENGKVVAVEGTAHLLWEDAFPPQERFARMVDELRAPYRSQLEEVLAKATEPIPRQYKSESPFDVLVGEMLRQETGADVALLPGIGYGISLQPGPVTRERLFSLLPHESTIVTLTMTGEQIRRVLEQSAANLRPDNPLEEVGGLVQTAGLSWNADLTRPAGERARDILLDGRPLHAERRYRVATHSGMLAGVHRYDSFQQGEEVEKTDEQLNELVERQMRERRQLEAPALGKVRVIGNE